jgi:prolyl 4-hydroxylase
MKELIINADYSFIGAWFFEDMSLCTDIIHWFENHNDKHPGYICNGDTRFIDESNKKSIDMDCDPLDPMSQRYEKEIQKIVNMYVKKYPMCAKTDRWVIDDFNVQKYEPGGAYFNWHSERTGAGIVSNRHLAFMTYLNDIDDQGETEFWHQKIKVTPKKGLTLIWPADWTHYHRGVASPTEVKYIVTGWFSFVPEQT